MRKFYIICAMLFLFNLGFANVFARRSTGENGQK